MLDEFMTDRVPVSPPSRLGPSEASFRLDPFDTHSKIARLIASSAGVSRADLARITGLARSTVSQHVQPLLDVGLIKEQETSPSARGRPATGLALNARAGVVLIADLGATHARLVVADLAQRRLAEHVFGLDPVDGPEKVLNLIIDEFASLLSTHRLTDRKVRSVVVGLPAPVDFNRGVPIRPPIMSGWDGFPVSQYVQERIDASVLVDNDVNLMALGEARSRPATQSPLMFVKVSTGIGCGVVTSEGILHRGADGAAGDIGHIRVAGRENIVCRCGNIGCVEAVASASALVRTLQQEGRAEVKNADDLEHLVRSGDPETVRLVRTAAAEIGDVIATAVHFYNPASIILGGRMSRISDDLLAGVRAVVYSRALPLATRSLSIENSQLGELAGAIGGVVLGIERALAPDSLAQMLQ
jgi:predicted NBD/HSP70 family sugar kinase